MTKKQQKCNEQTGHYWESQKGERNWYHIRGCGETLEKNIICSKCSLEAREIWIYSCTMDNENNEL